MYNIGKYIIVNVTRGITTATSAIPSENERGMNGSFRMHLLTTGNQISLRSGAKRPPLMLSFHEDTTRNP